MKEGSPVGACFGYKLERKADSSGRRFTCAVVDDRGAPIVERIGLEHLAGRGHNGLNHARIADRREMVPCRAVRTRRARAALDVHNIDINTAFTIELVTAHATLQRVSEARLARARAMLLRTEDNKGKAINVAGFARDKQARVLAAWKRGL